MGLYPFWPHKFGFKPLLGLEPMAPIRPQLLVSHANHSATETYIKRMFNEPMIYVVTRNTTVCVSACWSVCMYICMHAEKQNLKFSSGPSLCRICRMLYVEPMIHQPTQIINFQSIYRNPLSLLLNIFNKIWVSGYFPSDWRKAIIIPIPKPGEDPTNPTKYRPVALTSCICKTME